MKKLVNDNSETIGYLMTQKEFHSMAGTQHFKEVVQRIERILNLKANFRDLSDENQSSAVIYHNNYISLHTVKLIELEVNNECVFSIYAQGNRICLKFGIANS